jgi:hypothetical protein
MDSLLFVIAAILFVLWLSLVTVSTANLQIKRHAHRHGFPAGHRLQDKSMRSADGNDPSRSDDLIARCKAAVAEPQSFGDGPEVLSVSVCGQASWFHSASSQGFSGITIYCGCCRDQRISEHRDREQDAGAGKPFFTPQF